MKSTRTREFWTGARDSIPVIVGSIPFGIIFGALAINAGLSVAATLGMSLFVFAGSAQFVAAGLIAQHTAILVIILTTFVVNLRHALYSASLGPYLAGKSQRWLVPLGFWLTDETYAVVVQRYARGDDSSFRHWYHLGSSVAMYANWQLCTVVGLIAGKNLQGIADWGLEFAMVVTFTGIVVPLLRSVPMILCAVVAGLVSLIFRDLPHQAGLMAGALTGIAAAMLAGRLQTAALRESKTRATNTGKANTSKAITGESKTGNSKIKSIEKGGAA